MSNQTTCTGLDKKALPRLWEIWLKSCVLFAYWRQGNAKFSTPIHSTWGEPFSSDMYTCTPDAIGSRSRHLLYKRGSSIDQGRLERKLNRAASALDWMIGQVCKSLKERFKRSYRDTTKSVAAADVLKTGKYSSRRWRTGRLFRIIPLNYAFFHKHTFSYGIPPKSYELTFGFCTIPPHPPRSAPNTDEVLCQPCIQVIDEISKQHRISSLACKRSIYGTRLPVKSIFISPP